MFDGGEFSNASGPAAEGDVRFGLTELGDRALRERGEPRFRGFEPGRPPVAPAGRAGDTRSEGLSH